MNPIAPVQRKIIHIDMDCFYAAIEVRDHPELRNKPVAVGGSSAQRGVLCTCNYLARKYGVHSAMPTATALRLCPDLIVLPVNMPKYREISQHIQQIFLKYTPLVEPLSLDEAYLDVSTSPYHEGSATRIAQAIQQQIIAEHQLTASAGVAPNKFLAKIASAWKKPQGLFVLPPAQVDEFIKNLPVEKLFGVGKVTAQKLKQLNINTGNDLRHHSPEFLTAAFGKLGQQLYQQAYGIDHRPVEPNRQRKSLGIEKTLTQDITQIPQAMEIIKVLYAQLLVRIEEYAANLDIKSLFVKVKNSEFKLHTAECRSIRPNLQRYYELFYKANSQNMKAIRLVGIGVNFNYSTPLNHIQQSLFDEEMWLE